jgi:hypothetical protein
MTVPAALVLGSWRSETTGSAHLVKDSVGAAIAPFGATPDGMSTMIRNGGATPRHLLFPEHAGPAEEDEPARAAGGAYRRFRRTRSSREGLVAPCGGQAEVHDMEEVDDSLSLSLCDCAFALEMEDDRFLRFSFGSEPVRDRTTKHIPGF